MPGYTDTPRPNFSIGFALPNIAASSGSTVDARYHGNITGSGFGVVPPFPGTLAWLSWRVATSLVSAVGNVEFQIWINGLHRWSHQEPMDSFGTPLNGKARIGGSPGWLDPGVSPMVTDDDYLWLRILFNFNGTMGPSFYRVGLL